jgi:large subunit ribosomal protein L4e
MKSQILDKTGKSIKQIDLPENFSEKIRQDIILKVFEAQKRKTPMGTMFGAGAFYSASGISRKKRHSWKVTYGKGISRTPRKIMSRDGASFNWVGATAPNTRGGRRAHPPKAWENQFKKVNKKELQLAFNSALAATTSKEILGKKYNQVIKANIPVVFSDDVLKLKTKDFLVLLQTVFQDSFEKLLQKKTVRAGKGKLRGRKYKKNAGLLFVLGNDEKMNRKGIVVVHVNDLTVGNLAPNGNAGRFTVFTEKAVKQIGERFK